MLVQCYAHPMSKCWLARLCRFLRCSVLFPRSAQRHGHVNQWLKLRLRAAPYSAYPTHTIYVIVKLPVYRIDRGFKHEFWSLSILGKTTVLFEPWLWGYLVVDHKKLRLGSAKAKNSPIPSRVCRTAVSIAANTLVQMSSTPEKKGSFHRHRVRSHLTAKCI